VPELPGLLLEVLVRVVPSGSCSWDLLPCMLLTAGADDGRVDTSTRIEVSPVAAAQLLSVAADPVRWRLLSALAGGTRCVCQLMPIVRVSPPALSHHLRVLRDAGLVTSARRGRWIDYTLAPDAAQRLRAALPTAVLAVTGTGLHTAARELFASTAVTGRSEDVTIPIQPVSTRGHRLAVRLPAVADVAAVFGEHLAVRGDAGVRS
jgi:ArsR family transcriptional regulator, arsenate/arsenite/antimonite-responsive transcriptional repressor